VAAETARPHPGERALLAGALAVVALLAWAYLVHHAAMPTRYDGADFAMLALMWVVMMAAMMLPSVVPAVLVHAEVSRRLAPATAAARNAAFVAGYGVAWSAFALGAAALQLWLGNLALLAQDMRTASPLFGAALLAVAGAWQLTPMKDACLRRCRMPLQFVAEHWREGSPGALRMGLWHGGYCTGCCGAFMALLFVGGVMNLLWVAVIAAFVLLEKTTFPGTRGGRWASGAGLLVSAALVVSL
jgi:predicted metal-binding membrane protein